MFHERDGADTLHDTRVSKCSLSVIAISFLQHISLNKFSTTAKSEFISLLQNLFLELQTSKSRAVAPISFRNFLKLPLGRGGDSETVFLLVNERLANECNLNIFRF